SEPVTISVNGDSQQTLRPGDSLRMELRRGAPLSAAWHVVGPRSSSGDQLGESLGGTIREPEPQGDVRRRLDLSAAGSGYIVPRITSDTEDSLFVFLRDSTGERPCNCGVAPGAVDASLGYLRLDRTLGLTLVSASGGRASFDSDSLATHAAAGTGLVSLRVRRADLAVPIAASSTRRAQREQPAEPLRDLPDLRVSIPPPTPQPGDTAALVTDSAATPVQPDSQPKRDDPLGPIFQNR